MKKQIEDLGSIEITDNDYGPCTVAVRLVGGNVWMTQSQIARLFGVYEATVRNNLRAGFRGEMLREGKVSLLHKQNQRTTLNLPSFGLQFQVVIEICLKLQLLIYAFSISNFHIFPSQFAH